MTTLRDREWAAFLLKHFAFRTLVRLNNGNTPFGVNPDDLAPSTDDIAWLAGKLFAYRFNQPETAGLRAQLAPVQARFSRT